MLRASSRSGARLSLLALFLVGGFLGFFVSPSPASAALSGCRGDPIIFLSDGTIIRSSVTIAAPASAVESVEYVVYAPPGVTILKALKVGQLRLLESVELGESLQDGGYVIETVVTTTPSAQGPAVAVTATSWINGVSQTVTGVAGDTLIMELAP